MSSSDMSERGRTAEQPHQIPVAGWQDIGWRLWRQMGEDRVLLVSAGVTFYVLLALVPTLAALVALYGLAFDPQNVTEQMSALSQYLPAEAQTILEDQLTRLTAESGGTLSLAALGGLAIALWSASGAMKALIDGLNVVYGEDESRSWLRYNATALAMTLAGIIAVIVLLSVTVALPIVVAWIWPGQSQMLVQFASYALLFAAMWGIVIVLYRIAPNRAAAKWRWLAPGSLLAVLLLVLFSLAFSWYARTFAAYSATYGSLGTVIGFMTWSWISTAILLMGAELNAETEHQTARDSTTGPEKPMGERGAYVADTLGQTMESNKPAERRPFAPKSSVAEPASPARKPRSGAPSAANPAFLTLGTMVILGVAVGLAAARR